MCANARQLLNSTGWETVGESRYEFLPNERPKLTWTNPRERRGKLNVTRDLSHCTHDFVDHVRLDCEDLESSSQTGEA